MTDEPSSGNIILFPQPPDSSPRPSSLNSAAPSPPRRIARQLYLGLRPRARGAVGCLAGVLEALAHHRGALPAEAPPADPDLIRAWAVEDDWEGRYRQSCSTEVLDAPAAEAHHYLAELQFQASKAHELLRAVTEELDGPPPPEHDPAKPWPSAALLGRWQTALRAWRDLYEAVTRAREGVVRADREGTRDDYWDTQYESTRSRLTEHYVGGGPQYELLVDRLAALDVRLRQVERSGRAVATDEYKALHDLHLKYVAQLQKHTEALISKSEQPVQEAITRIVGILERRIKTANPPLWALIVEDIVQAVGDQGAA